MGPLRAGAAAVAAVVVAGCAAAPAPPDRYYGQTLDWKACGDFQCATLTVPVDYAQPDGPTFALPVIKKPATGQRIGVLVAGAGGPGQSGVEMVRDSPESFPAEVREKFDVVSFDNRGVGGSEPRIECPVEGEPTEEAPDLELVGPDVPGSKQYAQACVKATGEHVLRNVGTANVIRDLDVLRAATGQDKLTYVGYSYGTRVGQLYAERYPDKVRAMVLDGVDNVFLDWRDDAVQQAEGAEQALHVYARECTTRVDACPGEDEAAILAAVNDALARADETGDGDALRSDIAGKLPFPAEWAAIADLVAPASDQPEEPEQPAEGPRPPRTTRATRSPS
ncbi:alpha/beta hydrolase [Actinokineospora soli]|uniref:Alpha/beta hydrolase n=1 Tax=Actinokineospora soli TaxID=1048753 RepID=A0ABW2TUD1_9PSEU